MTIWATEIKVRAERLAGIMLRDMQKAKGGGDGSNQHVATSTHRARVADDGPTLEELGITRKQSSKWQQTARIPEEVFEEHIEAEKVKRQPPTVDSLRKKVQRDQRHQEVQEQAVTSTAQGNYALLYADPPWTFDTFSWKGKEISPEVHYPTMTIDDIKDFEVGGRCIPDLALKDAGLFMWCTSSNLHLALEVMESWGFTYKTNAVWDKQRSGTGYIFLNQHELLLYGSRGKFPAPQNIRASVFSYKRGKHSAKPPEVREALEDMYPHFDDKTRIELFARENIPGWTVDGYESC
jgi:N6-adenosine-specific RNA methylase IME4